MRLHAIDPAKTRRSAHVIARYVALGVGGACSLTAFLTTGLAGLAAAALAAVLVIGFFTSGMLPLFLVPRGQQSAFGGMMLALLTYTLRLVLLLLVLRFARRSDVLEPRWMGGVIVVCSLAWVVAHVTVSWGGRQRRGKDSGPDFVASTTTK